MSSNPLPCHIASPLTLCSLNEGPSASTDVEPPVPVYEEIGDSPGAFKYTQCPVYGLSPDVLMSEGSHHEYEDVKLKDTPKSCDSSAHTVCSI